MSVITDPRLTNSSRSFVFELDPVPLYMDSEGEVRVVGTRIPLEAVIWSFEQGDTPDEIVDQYDSLNVADVYAIIGYYLRHRDTVDAYVRERRALEEQVRGENEAFWPPDGVRERLLVRIQSKSSSE